MIWIATLLIIAIAAWFMIEGNNERRWVEEHQHDETVAADKGYFSKYNELKDAPEPAERYSVANAEGRVGRFAAKAREKTASVSKIVEDKMPPSGSNPSINDDEKRQRRAQRGHSLTGPDSWLGKTADRLSEKTARISDRIPEGRLVSDSKDGSVEPGTARRYIKKVTDRLEQIDAKVK